MLQPLSSVNLSTKSSEDMTALVTTYLCKQHPNIDHRLKKSFYTSRHYILLSGTLNVSLPYMNIFHKQIIIKDN